MASRELNILIKAKDLTGAAISGVKKELGNLGKTASRGLSNASRNITRGIEIGAVAAGGALIYAVKQAGDFEAALNTINTVAQVSDRELTAIGDSLRALARTTGTSLADLSAGYYDLVSAGISAADAQDVLAQSNTLAIGGLSTTAEAIDLLTTAINSYGGDATKAAEYANMFAQAVAAGKVTVSEIAGSFAQVGPLAASFGIGLDELAAGLAQMTAKGVPAAEATTFMRAAIVALQRQTPQMVKVLEELHIADAQQYADKFGLANLYDKLRSKAEELGIPMIKLTGRQEALQFAIMNTGDALDDYNKNLEKVRRSSEGNGVAAEQMAQRQKGLNFQLARLKEQANDIAITLGQAIIPKLIPLFEKASRWIEDNRRQIKIWAGDLAKGIENLVKWGASLDWDAIGNSLKTAAGFAKGVVEAFLSMPPWVQQAVVTGWGLNKLTGGALGSIIGQLAGGLIKGVMNMNAGVVNLRAGTVIGGGAPGAGLPGAGGGSFLPKGAMGWAGLVGIAIADAFLVKTAIDTFNQQKQATTVAADYQQKVVDDRARTSNVAELNELRRDLTGTLEQDLGNPLDNILKWAFVNENIERQIEQVDQEILAQSAHIQRGDSQTHATLRATNQSVINEFRTGRMALERKAEVVAQRVSEARTALGTGFAATNAQLGGTNTKLGDIGVSSRITAAKDFSPNVNVALTANTTVSVDNVIRAITTSRVSSGWQESTNSGGI